MNERTRLSPRWLLSGEALIKTRMHYPAVGSKTALVTGCSTGIGLATARMLKQAGWQVVPTARKPEDLDRLRAEGFAPVRLDVADSASVHEAARRPWSCSGGNSARW
jgi:NADP-dependent 3-hydroxy acid dehydrogenase YdfG